VHQPQGFHRCEVHGPNGDHDTPPGLHCRRLPARWHCLPGMPHLPHSAISMRTLSGPRYVTFAWLGCWPRPDGPRLPAVSRGVSLVAPACSIRSVHASTVSARKLQWCIPLQATPCAPMAERSVTKRLLSSTTAKAHGSASWRGMDGAFAPRLHLWEDSTPALLHASYTHRCSQQRCPATFL